MRSPGPEAGKRAPWERGRDTDASLMVAFDDNRLASVLFGRYGENLALIERRLGVAIDQRGNHVSIDGPRDACEKARKTLEGLYEELRAGRDVTAGDVEGALRAAQTQTSFFDSESGTEKTAFGDIRLRKRAVRARTPMQDAYIKAMQRNTLVFGIGPAGTGRPGSRSPMPCISTSGAKSIVSCFPVLRSKPASGWASCPATCVKRSIPICARCTTRFTI